MSSDRSSTSRDLVPITPGEGVFRYGPVSFRLLPPPRDLTIKCAECYEVHDLWQECPRYAVVAASEGTER